MASADLRDELFCTICLRMYTNPVMLRCGHNFCQVCIDRVLDTQVASGVYSCPVCRDGFQEKPTLYRCFALSSIVRDSRHGEPHQQEVMDIYCTYCVDSPAPAVKSCLHCEASLCDKHLEVHSESPEHVLCEPRTFLEKRKCPVHKKILEYYCTEDSACICVSCILAGAHRGHKVKMLDEASEKKEILGNADCTYCVDFPVPAVKSCLLCEASLCDKHLKVHSGSSEHVLCEPGTSLEERKCPVHKKILEYYCTKDSADICGSCILAGAHRGHKVEMMDKASEKKKQRNVPCHPS